MDRIMTGMAIGALAVLVPAAVALAVIVLAGRAGLIGPQARRAKTEQKPQEREPAQPSAQVTVDAQMDALLGYDGRIKKAGEGAYDDE